MSACLSVSLFNLKKLPNEFSLHMVFRIYGKNYHDLSNGPETYRYCVTNSTGAWVRQLQKFL